MKHLLCLLAVGCGAAAGFQWHGNSAFIATDVALVLCLQAEVLGSPDWPNVGRGRTITVSDAGDKPFECSDHLTGGCTHKEGNDFSIVLTIHPGANTEDTPFTHEMLHVYAFTHGYADGDFNHTADFWSTDILVISAINLHRRHPEYSKGMDFPDVPPHTGAFANPIYTSSCFGD